MNQFFQTLRRVGNTKTRRVFDLSTFKAHGTVQKSLAHIDSNENDGHETLLCKSSLPHFAPWIFGSALYADSERKSSVSINCSGLKNQGVATKAAPRSVGITPQPRSQRSTTPLRKRTFNSYIICSLRYKVKGSGVQLGRKISIRIKPMS